MKLKGDSYKGGKGNKTTRQGFGKNSRPRQRGKKKLVGQGRR